MTAPTTVASEPAGATDDGALLRVENLSMRFPIRGRGVFSRVAGYVNAVNSVDLTVQPGEVLGLVGESGCGKTTLGRCIVRTNQPDEGHIYYRDAGGTVSDLARLGTKALRPFQQQIRVIFQDPFSSLNPRMTILQIVGDPLKANGIARGSELEDRVAETLRKVGLSPGHMRRYPHAFSGGERQRVNIARALILEPRLIIADEAVSALDVSIRAQILNLLRDLQDEFDLTYIFISHDLSVVESMCNRVAVMYLGKIVELADTAQLFTDPQHPYTEALMSAVPLPDPRLRNQGARIRLSDEFPDPSDLPSGCYFHTRCNYADENRCTTERPELRDIPGAKAKQHMAACHYSETLDLAGVSNRLDNGSAPAGASDESYKPPAS